jgi:hypothetical protein
MVSLLLAKRVFPYSDNTRRHSKFCERIILLALLGILIFVGIYTLFFVAIYPKWHELERLAHAGIQTSGRVTAKEPSNHQGIRYEYRVGADTYSGISTAGFGGVPRFDQIRVGDQIAVTYWPERPTVSIAGSPDEMYGSWSGLLFIIMPLGIAIFMAIAINRAAARTRKKLQRALPNCDIGS